jgi:hypothetical protein
MSRLRRRLYQTTEHAPPNLAEIPWLPKCNTVDLRHMALKMDHVIKDDAWTSLSIY